jgi:prephenate dehydrogenase
MKIAVLGVGLIGGSIGMAARRRTDAYVCGYDSRASVLDEALAVGAIDAHAPDIAAAVRDADAVFVATPVGALAAAAVDALAAAGERCVVTDVGSTKRVVAAAARDERFVGGHPLAGAEGAGVAQARADMFDGATWYLTPNGGTSGVLYERLHRLLVGLGAQPAAIEAGAHDRLMACVSHLPHVLANVLVGQAAGLLNVGDQGDAGARAAFAGGAPGPSFRDATRVAGANSAIWTDIYMANGVELLERIDATIAELQRVRGLFEAADADAIGAWNEGARADKRRLSVADAAGEEAQELRAMVPNRPGVIAEIALALGEAGVNIVDMALSPSADNRQGVVALWVRGSGQAAAAQRLVGDLGFVAVRA